MRYLLPVAATILFSASCFAADDSTTAKPRLVIDGPKEGEAVDGAAIIRFHTENLQVDPKFGDAAAKRQPAIGHLHVTIDDLPLLLVYTSKDPLVLAALKPGAHTVKIDLANPNHQVLDSHVLHFTMK